MRSAATTAPSNPLDQLYRTLDTLRDQVNGPYTLVNVGGRADWTDHGVYFFFSPKSSLRRAPPEEWRLSRIGTVGVSDRSTNTLWNWLRQYMGNIQSEYAGDGNHRGSTFGLHIGRTFIERHDWFDRHPHWGGESPDIATTSFVSRNAFSSSASRPTSASSRSCAWRCPGRPLLNQRAFIEQNLIATVSHHRRTAGPSNLDWLGYHSPKSAVYESRLWNVRHVSELLDSTAVDVLREYVPETTSSSASHGRVNAHKSGSSLG